MRVELSTFGKFHTFDLARQLHSAGHLSRVYTGYPRFKLGDEGIPRNSIHTFPYLIAPMLGLRNLGWLPPRLIREWDYLSTISLARWIKWRKAEADVFIGLSASGLEAGIATQQQGGLFVCDRGSAHIRVQDDILRDEHERWDFKYTGIDPRIIAREETEYRSADLITVPSSFAARSFIEMGFSEDKVRTIPYGVDLTKFSPSARPDQANFSVVFVGRVTLQKGIPYLLDGFKRLSHPGKRLRIVGPYDKDFVRELYRRKLVPPGTEFLGAVPQPRLNQIFSTSDVLVLPSVQDGFGMVMAQAMACGCPVIASTNTGAADLISHRNDGFIIPTRSAEDIAAHLSLLAEDRPLAAELRIAAITKVSTLGGWDSYGREFVSMLQAALRMRIG